LFRGGPTGNGKEGGEGKRRERRGRDRKGGEGVPECPNPELASLTISIIFSRVFPHHTRWPVCDEYNSKT